MCYCVIRSRLPGASEEAKMKIRSGGIALATLLAALWMAGCATTQDKQAQADRRRPVFGPGHGQGRQDHQRGVHGAHQTIRTRGWKFSRSATPVKTGYLTYDEVWSQRMMLPPELTHHHAAVGPAGAVEPSGVAVASGRTGVHPAGEPRDTRLSMRAFHPHQMLEKETSCN